MQKTELTSDEPVVERIAVEILERRRGGETVTVDEYCDRYPEHADELRAFLPALLAVEKLKPNSKDKSGPLESGIEVSGKTLDAIGDYRILKEIGRGGMGVVYEAEQQSLGRRVALKVLPGPSQNDSTSLMRFQREAKAAARMHHTNIVPVFEIGQEDNQVFYAMQLIQGQGLDFVIGDLRRMRSEHDEGRKHQGPGKAGDYESRPAPSLAASLVSGRFGRSPGDGVDGNDFSDVSNERPVIDNALVETVLEASGSTHSAVLPGNSDLSSAENNRLAYFRSVAEIGLQTSNALAYAHARGIIHRDIKPSNLLLDTTGVVWVTDFGLAKTGDSTMTHTGDILGTIRYMSPERFKGHCDARADVYSLGLTLYELLVLKPAFDSPDRLQLIDMVAKTEAPTPRSIDSRIPRDLETIVIKASDKDPRLRYQSADDLAEDLHRFIHDEPIHARRISLPERFSRWARRNRSLAAALMSLTGLMLVLLIGSSTAAVFFHSQEEAQRQLADDNKKLADNLQAVVEQKQVETKRALVARDEAESARDEADLARRAVVAEQEITRRNLYFSQINMAQLAGVSGDAARQQSLIVPWRQTDPDHKLRGWEWYYLRGGDAQAAAAFGGHDGTVGSVRLSPDGTKIAAVGETITIWSRQSLQKIRSLGRNGGMAYAVAWSHDSRRLATGSHDKSVRIWDVTDLHSGDKLGRQLLRFEHHKGAATTVDFSPDGTRLATGGRDDVVHVIDAGRGYLQELAPQLLTGLNRRISQGLASVDDFRTRASIRMRQGEWSAAADDLDRVAELDPNSTWFQSDVWIVNRPYPGELETSYAPEAITATRDGDVLRPLGSDADDVVEPAHWKRAEIDLYGLVSEIDFTSRFGLKASQTGYALIRAYSTQDQDVVLLLAADDLARVWHNGRLLREKLEQPRLSRSPDFMNLRLQAGWNTVLIKVASTKEDTGHGLGFNITDAPVHLSMLMAGAGKYKEAGIWIDRAIEQFPTDPSLRLRRARLRWKAGDKDLAIRDLEDVLKLPLPESALRRARATTQFQLRRFDEALEDLDRLVALDPDDIDARKMRGNWNARRWNLEQAEADLTHAYELNPDDHWNAYCLTSLRVFLGKDKEYDDLRHEMLDRWEHTSNITIIGRTGKAALLTPSSGHDLKRAFAMTEEVGAKPPSSGFYGWYQLHKGIGQLRLGQDLAANGDDASAKQAFESARRTFLGIGSGFLNRKAVAPVVHACQAMISESLGDGSRAQTSMTLLAKAEEKLTGPSETLGTHWHDNIMARIFAREAHRTVGETARTKVEQARVLFARDDHEPARQLLLEALVDGSGGSDVIEAARAEAGESVSRSATADVGANDQDDLPDVGRGRRTDFARS